MERWTQEGDEKYIYYYYDESGVCGMNYNGSEYYFHKNILGDVLEVYDKYGSLQCRYVYDAWGNHKAFYADGTEIASDINTIGNINPIRYRGYYWDSEFGLYYLQSRYYDPAAGRFISPDDVSYLDPESVVGLNLYAYCGNNPVMNVDPNGSFFLTALLVGLIVGATVGAVVGGTIAGMNAYEEGVRGWELFGNILLGGIVGGAIGAVAGTIAGGMIGAGGVFMGAGASMLSGSFALAGGGTAAFGTALAGVGAVALGGTLVIGGVLTGVKGLNIFFNKGRPGDNQKQNEQFSTIMKGFGYKRTDPVWQTLHELLHYEEPMNFQELLEFIKSFLGR